MFSMVSRSKSVRREESLKPLAKGLLSIFSLVIWREVVRERRGGRSREGGVAGGCHSINSSKSSTKRRRQCSPAGSGKP